VKKDQGMTATDKNGIGVLGAGKYVPSKVITNQMLEEWTGMPAATIAEKIGIQTRYIVEDDETASGMSAIAAKQAIEMAGIDVGRIGLILGCGFTGDYVYPAMACKVQGLIGAKNAGAFDLMANCTGFQVGLGVAADRMACDSGIEYALVIGTALQSRFINWKDPNTAIYFGDGSGAVILGRVPSGYGVMSNEVFSNAKAFEAVRMRGGGSSFPLRAENVNDGLQYYEMNGMEVWKQVVQYQPLAIRRSLEKIDKKVTDVDFFIFHQANLHLITYLMGKMKQPMNKTYINVIRIGNTADASIAVALCEALREGLLKRGDLIVVSGVGAGFIFGSTVIRWY
jgi:3-oxoacyl-[acyl-carrier-protein] synthase-3